MRPSPCPPVASRPRRRGLRVRALVSTVSLLVALAGPAGAAEDAPSTGDRVFDALLIRPTGALGTVVGFVFFVCSLPLAGPTLQTEAAWDTFVAKPAGYTFGRELGDF